MKARLVVRHTTRIARANARHVRGGDAQSARSENRRASPFAEVRIEGVAERMLMHASGLSRACGSTSFIGLLLLSVVLLGPAARECSRAVPASAKAAGNGTKLPVGLSRASTGSMTQAEWSE